MSEEPEDDLTIAYLHGFKKGKEDALKWLPIEGAPKDGEILISCLVKKTGCRTKPRIYTWHKTNDDDKYEKEGWSEGGDYYGTKWISDIYEPTHYMPLPSPPRRDAEHLPKPPTGDET